MDFDHGTSFYDLAITHGVPTRSRCAVNNAMLGHYCPMCLACDGDTRSNTTHWCTSMGPTTLSCGTKRLKNLVFLICPKTGPLTVHIAMHCHAQIPICSMFKTSLPVCCVLWGGWNPWDRTTCVWIEWLHHFWTSYDGATPWIWSPKMWKCLILHVAQQSVFGQLCYVLTRYRDRAHAVYPSLHKVCVYVNATWIVCLGFYA